jgi:hypothetical protein
MKLHSWVKLEPLPVSESSLIANKENQKPLYSTAERERQNSHFREMEMETLEMKWDDSQGTLCHNGRMHKISATQASAQSALYR